MDKATALVLVGVGLGSAAPVQMANRVIRGGPGVPAPSFVLAFPERFADADPLRGHTGITNRPGMGRPATNIVDPGQAEWNDLKTDAAAVVDAAVALASSLGGAGPMEDMAELPNDRAGSAGLGDDRFFSCFDATHIVSTAKYLACLACNAPEATASGCGAAHHGVHVAINACFEVCSPGSQCITAAELAPC